MGPCPPVWVCGTRGRCTAWVSAVRGGVSRGSVTRVGLCRAWVGTRVGEWEPMWLNHPEWVSGSHAWGGGVRIWRCHAWVCATSG